MLLSIFQHPTSGPAVWYNTSKPKTGKDFGAFEPKVEVLVGGLDPGVGLGNGPRAFPNLVGPGSPPNFVAFWAVWGGARGPSACRHPFWCPDACLNDGGQHTGFTISAMPFQVFDMLFPPRNVGTQLHTFTMEMCAGLIPKEQLEVLEYLFPDLVFEQVTTRVKFPCSPFRALPLPGLHRIPTYVQEDSNQVMYGPDNSPPPGEGV